ncbi:MAG TPA: GNAT family protein [Bryobacteraceae bacterium]|nr:GNAT family protein [Bryobacteraceae bacterium]
MFSASLRDGFELRLLEERHARPLFVAVEREREHLRPWLPWVEATHSEEDTLSFIRSVLAQFAENRGFAAGIWTGARLAGTIGVHRIDWLNRRVEIGYWLGREYEGRGIMTAACRAVVTHLFRELELHRVEIRCAVENAKSAAIAKRLGFALEGTLREAQLADGRYRDLLVFGMLRQDWKA